MNDTSPLNPALLQVDERSFRRACSAFATGITVVTALSADGNPIGMTVNSFTSVSLNPPMVLWTIGSGARSFDAFCRASHYAVHILHKDQQELAANFASSSDQKFAGLEMHAGLNSLPILPDYSVCLECRLEHIYPCGNQNLLVGRVLRIDDRAREDALLYFRSRFTPLN